MNIVGWLVFIIMMLLIIALPLLFIGGIVFIFVRARKGSAGRAGQMQAVANQMSWTFSRQIPYTSLPYANYFHLFTQAIWQRIYNLMSGQINGVQVVVFDYTYGKKWGNKNRLKAQTVALLMSNKVNLPAFYLRPSSLKHKLGAAFSNSVNFPSHAAFSSQYLLSGNDEPGIRQAFNDSVLSYCESNPGVSIEAGGGQMFVYREESLTNPQQVGGLVESSLQVFTLFENVAVG